MGETTVAKISRPQLRGLLASAIKHRLIVGTVIAIGSAIFYKVAVCMPRKQKYADFYKTYDAEKEFEIMRKKGLFQSC